MMRVMVVMLAAMLLAGTVQADVFNMGGTRSPDGSWTGRASLETVPVGNPGNAADSTGFGAVGYEYNIGKYEVTAGQYTEFLNAVGGVDTHSLYDTNMSNMVWGSGIARSGGGTVGNPYVYSVDAAFVNRPVNFVSWGAAARFANWLQNNQPTGAQGLTTTEDGAYNLSSVRSLESFLAITREADWKWAITSEDEWYKAAYYNPTTGTYFGYPTGSNTSPGRDMADASGNNANYRVVPGTFPIDSGKYTTVVGEFQNSDSPYGTYDQGGNVEEWNETIVPDLHRGWRGGSYGFGTEDLHASYRYDFDPVHGNQYLGFRVSQVPEPASMAVLALGFLGLLKSRRNRRR